LATARDPVAQSGHRRSPEAVTGMRSSRCRAPADGEAAGYNPAPWSDGPVPRPARWGGFRLRPDQVELWQGRENRLHDRLRYRRAGGGWVRERLAP
jgi:pyridoxamine 5'-phosphate oxidase